jgi:hypothetical protein
MLNKQPRMSLDRDIGQAAGAGVSPMITIGGNSGRVRIGFVGRTVHRWPTYNLFCRHDAPDLVCAVPNDRPVPPFVQGPSWFYAGSIEEPAAAPAGFSAAAAECGVGLSGFHLFQRLPRHPAGSVAGRRRCATAFRIA